MKLFRRHSAAVNAGSMADIAFLLLIFFLVTTTISADKGILRQLPPVCETANCTTDIHERNLLHIAMNEKQEIMIDNELVELTKVKEIVERFIDNNGLNACDYCTGAQAVESSDHPEKAVISLSHDAFTKYDAFISVQDEITKAYYDLRTRYAEQKFNKSPVELTNKELKLVQKAYPFKVSEIMVKRSYE
ncbi:ExbD/TolR family protein [Winogradskyella bathintestinalis]|uniref:Biopolymer transporter ExbD n=1 Tax=Winogradskyella bathintestinalis TaxID=3035208 RepID=A0ABT7ZY26_9FLAO|nr:biopolymer transporter ExbD [Winogradskyella bathintestinalis]MDN3493643.1 biopolymer transporter ExbD [Winogradskyella bathintestinalis]